MAKIDEQQLFAGVVGSSINYQNVEQLATKSGDGSGSYSDCSEYCFTHVNYYDKPEFREKFRLSESLFNYWDQHGIDFSFYIYVREKQIIGGKIYKYIEINSGDNDIPNGYETDASQRELAIVKRMLNYITTGGKRK